MEPYVPEGARCEICGLDDPLLLRRYVLGRGFDRTRTVLCANHAAPVEAGVLGRTGEPHRPTRPELFEFWEERRPGIVWMSPERRVLRDRRAGARFARPERRRVPR
jgi:hypothetical protein